MSNKMFIDGHEVEPVSELPSQPQRRTIGLLIDNRGVEVVSERRCIVIDGRLPVSAIVTHLLEHAISGAGVAIDFYGVEDAMSKQMEINAMIREINETAHRRFVAALNPVPPEGNRKARRAAAAQRRGKW